MKTLWRYICSWCIFFIAVLPTSL